MCVCLNAGFIASGCAWHCGPMLCLRGPRLRRGDMWACSLPGVTFDYCQVARWAWQEVKGEAVAVNEADYTIEIVRTVRPEERQCMKVKWVGGSVAPPTQELR